jgi:hypothetical protein
MSKLTKICTECGKEDSYELMNIDDSDTIEYLTCDDCMTRLCAEANAKKAHESLSAVSRSKEAPKQVTIEDLWQPEWNECVGQPGIPGAAKYGLNNYLEPEGQSIRFPKNCDSIFHHLAREYVYLENKDAIDTLIERANLLWLQGEVTHADIYAMTELLRNLKFDADTKVRHIQSVGWRACAGYTREKRGLPK